MEIELFQGAVDRIELFAMLVHAIERVSRSLHCQCWNFESFAVWGDGGNARGYAKTEVVKPGQLIHHRVNLLCVHPLRCEGENSSQRMNRWLSQNRCLIWSSWRTVRTAGVFPMPPASIRAIGVRRCAKRTIFSVSSSRPKRAFGGGGGSSPGTLDANVSRRVSQQSILPTCSESRTR